MVAVGAVVGGCFGLADWLRLVCCFLLGERGVWCVLCGVCACRVSRVSCLFCRLCRRVGVARSFVSRSSVSRRRRLRGQSPTTSTSSCGGPYRRPPLRKRRPTSTASATLARQETSAGGRWRTREGAFCKYSVTRGNDCLPAAPVGHGSSGPRGKMRQASPQNKSRRR